MILKNLSLPVKLFVKECKKIPGVKIGLSRKNNCLKFYSEVEQCTYYFYLDGWESTEFLESGIVRIKLKYRRYNINTITGYVYISC